jgi:hypothetical protein
MNSKVQPRAQTGGNPPRDEGANMRTTLVSTILGFMCVFALAESASAVGGGEINPVLSGGYGSDECDYCDACGGRGHHHGHRHQYEGSEPGFNCGCNGSYKFPVPPLYTYHWPGMWSAQLMTDYHSPWRFPPLKPYIDEVPTTTLSSSKANRGFRQVSNSVNSPAPEAASFSSHLEALGR